MKCGPEWGSAILPEFLFRKPALPVVTSPSDPERRPSRVALCNARTQAWDIGPSLDYR